MTTPLGELPPWPNDLRTTAALRDLCEYAIAHSHYAQPEDLKVIPRSVLLGVFISVTLTTADQLDQLRAALAEAKRAGA